MKSGSAGRADEPYSFEDLGRDLSVSRETFLALGRYGSLLEAWQKKFNLVSSKSLPDMWRRHFRDSAQLLEYVDVSNPVWLDFGSGAGFPGLVAAILLQDLGGGEVHLVESTGKKCRFLREVAQETLGPQSNVKVTVHNERLESMQAFPVDVISARAVTALTGLLEYSHRFSGPKTVFLFPKGQDVDQELTDAAKYWNIDLDKYSSHTDDRGVILRIKHLSPKETKSGRTR